MGQTAVIVSGKGGVGKSTVSVGLAAALCRRGRRVLLVDGDAGLRGLDYLLGVTQDLGFDLADAVSGACEPMKAVYPCPAPGGERLFLLPAPAQEEDCVSPQVMCQLVGALQKLFDFVLIDGPAGLGRAFRAAVAPAGQALVVVTPEGLSVRGGERASQALRQAGVEKQRLIINQFDKALFRRQGQFPDLDAVIDACGVQLGAVIPQDGQMVAGMAQGRLPAGRSPAVQAFDRLAARMEGERVALPQF